MKRKIRQRCRACESKELVDVIGFREYPLFDDRVAPERLGSEFLGDLPIKLCHSCGLVQNPYDIDFSDYYDDYVYSSGKSLFAVQYLERLVAFLKPYLSSTRKPKIVDIGSGDGGLLRQFKDTVQANVLGFEASRYLCALSASNNVPTINRLFTRDCRLELERHSFDCPDLICLLHTFDHLPDPNSFLLDVASVLPVGGLLMLEVHSLDKMVERLEGAIFGHEHTCYFSKKTISQILNRHGYAIVAYNFIDDRFLRGASQILLCRYTGRPSVEHLICQKENFSISKFVSDLSVSNKNLRMYVEKRVADGGRLAGFGGWGRGVTSIAQAELRAKHLVCVFDNNQSLDGCYIPGTEIPIRQPSNVSLKGIDEVIVFNYAYMDEIKRQLSALCPDLRVTNVNSVRITSL